jgi:hypothetical protein
MLPATSLRLAASVARRLRGAGRRACVMSPGLLVRCGCLTPNSQCAGLCERFVDYSQWLWLMAAGPNQVRHPMPVRVASSGRGSRLAWEAPNARACLISSLIQTIPREGYIYIHIISDSIVKLFWITTGRELEFGLRWKRISWPGCGVIAPKECSSSCSGDRVPMCVLACKPYEPFSSWSGSVARAISLRLAASWVCVSSGMISHWIP